MKLYLKTQLILWMVPVLLLLSSVGVYAADSLSDQQARIFKVQGNVRLLKPGGVSWDEVKSGTVIEAGDQVFTGSEAFCEITFDDQFLNTARMDENTKAEFKSIEPTDLRLEDGSVFSALEDLKGSTYQISTPVAVAAVRGTHLHVNYDPVLPMMEVSVIPDEREVVSRVEIISIHEDGSQGELALLEEGKQINLEPNLPAKVKPVDPSQVERAKEYLHQMTQDSKIKDPIEDKRKEDQNKKLPGGGNGGDSGDQGGGKSTEEINSNSGSMLQRQSDSSVDALADTLVEMPSMPWPPRVPDQIPVPDNQMIKDASDLNRDALSKVTETVNELNRQIPFTDPKFDFQVNDPGFFSGKNESAKTSHVEKN